MGLRRAGHVWSIYFIPETALRTALRAAVLGSAVGLQPDVGRVSASSCVSQASATAALLPHISCDGLSWPQTRGRAGSLKIRQRLSSSSCRQRTPAGLPLGMPGMGELMEGAMQHAPQSRRQIIDGSLINCY